MAGSIDRQNMIVGVTKEIKADEYRVGLLPVGAELLTRSQHEVLIEKGAGEGSGYSDAQYTEAGARICANAEEIWSRAELLVKVKEPQPTELSRLRRGQQVFTYFHFAADKALTEACLKAGIVAIAYETLRAQGVNGGITLPLLTPMSEVAGRLAVQEGAKYLERPQMGRGILLGGVPGVEPGEVLIIGGGVVGSNAAIAAAGLGANVTIMDVNLERLRYLADVMPANVTTIYSDDHAIRKYIASADLVIGAVLIPAALAPVLIRREYLKQMKPGAVIVDVAVDQGGCVETTRPTTHANPTFVLDDIVHYCVTNMPGAVGRTSSQALTNATLPWVLKLAQQGASKLAEADPWFKPAINMVDGALLSEPVAEAHGLPLG